MSDTKETKVTGPNWEIPENAKKVEIHYPASWAEKIGLNLVAHPETLEVHIKEWIVDEIQENDPEVRVSYKINKDHSFVVTLSSPKPEILQKAYEGEFEKSFKEGVEIIAF